MLRLATSLSLGIVCGTGCVAGPAAEVDVWIRGGTVVDGSGAPARRADVGIRGDRIAFVGDPGGPVTARRLIDAGGRVVTPGFIDAHAHGDPRRTPAFHNFTAMGVTTLCLGMDGSSPGGADFLAWRSAVAAGRFAPNLAAFVGHGTVRRLSGAGHAAPPTAEQLRTMVRLVREAMAAGAFGLSTGLEYEPGRFAGPDELARVAGPVAAYGGVVMSHVRSEDDDRLEDALAELVLQCDAAGCRAHVSHLKIVYGHGEARARAVLAFLDRARAAGSGLTADVYPYLASYTGIGIVFPDWARPPNDFELVCRTRRAELADYLRQRVTARNGPSATLFGSGPFRGRTLAQVAADLGKPFEEVLIEDVGPQGASAAYFVMAPEVMRTLLTDPHVVVSSDGSPTMRHPRGYGAFARVLREFVRERRSLTLEQAVHKMSGATAALLGLPDRGVLRPGAFADVLVFDAAAVADRATFAAPFQPATGFDVVLVNGQLVRDGGRPTAARPGRLLRRPHRSGG